MNKIQVLPEIIANKIAAGEIVERPASVVKELVENSIDAQCRFIHITVLSGGKRLITVRDDGSGMNQDDAILAFEHHATSKLRTADDLAAVTTLGFRGEALPSIAAVSRLTLRTRAADEESITGTEVEIHGGVLRSVKPVSWDRGTEVTARDLFYNVPARRKFLRSRETELSHIARLVTHYALAHPEIRFALLSDGRVLLDAVSAGNLRDRVYQIFGEGFLDNLVEIHGASGSMEVRGFCSLPHEQRTNPYSQFFYVNRRMVRDKVITGAVRQAYHNSIPASAYPVVILFVDLPFENVDVNAHPAKTEIRFRDPSAVRSLVLETMERALTRGAAIPSYEHRADAPAPASFGAGAESRTPLPEELFDFTRSGVSSDPFQRAFNYPFREVPDGFHTAEESHVSLRILPEMLYDTAEETSRPFQSEGVRILGQLRDSYIIACDSRGLLIIDQHVAHERILYEKLAAAVRGSAVETQLLLVPISLDLAPHQAALLRRVMPELERNGFQVEPFGGPSVLIRSVPAVAGDADCRKLLLEIIEGLESDERTLDVGKIRDRIAVATACRAAVKVNTPLAPEKMRWLLDELAQTRIPTNCPHGRPILLRFSLYEIERNFGRT